MGRRKVGSKGSRLPGAGPNSRQRTRGRQVGTRGARPVSIPLAKPKGPNGCKGNDGTCAAYPVKGTNECYGHSRSE